MSADNWAVCPNCLEKHNQETTILRKQLEEAYGTMPIDGFYTLKHELDTRPDTIEESLREDYEVGVDGTSVYVHYSCSCTDCGLSVSRKEDNFIQLLDSNQTNDQNMVLTQER